MPTRKDFDINKRDIHVRYSDDELKETLIQRVLEDEGLNDAQGKPIAGVTAKCIRDNRAFKVMVTHDRGAQKLLSK